MVRTDNAIPNKKKHNCGNKPAKYCDILPKSSIQLKHKQKCIYVHRDTYLYKNLDSDVSFNQESRFVPLYCHLTL